MSSLQPCLTKNNFKVYHVDGQGKQQGVVYSEMASREKSEADLLDHALRRHVYSGATTYSYVCGGHTRDIARLTNADIRRYHHRFYHLDNLTVILSGDRLDAGKILTRIVREPGLLVCDPIDKEKTSVIVVPASLSHLPSGKPTITETVRFPSADDDIGSIGYGWRGPPADDIDTIVAIDVLMRYLHETAASPFGQRFVERKNPLSNQVDFEFKGFVETCMVLVFSGVPVRGDGKGTKKNGKDKEQEDTDGERKDRKNEGDEEDEDEEEGDDEEGGEDTMSEDDEDEDEEIADGDTDADNEAQDLFAPGHFHSLVVSVFSNLVQNGFPDMSQTISRHRTKILESLEDDPHEVITAYLVPDIIFNHFHERSQWRNGNGGKFTIGTRVRIFAILDDLATKPLEFWNNLARKWFVEAPVVEVMMLPSVELGKALEAESQAEQQERINTLGTKGLAALAETVVRAVEANKVNLPPEVLGRMPPVPEIENVPRLPAIMRMRRLDDDGNEKERSFGVVQSVETDTYFAHLQICLPVTGLAEELRPYLTLFQELFFQCPLVIPRRIEPIKGKEGTRWETETIDYRAVVTQISNDLVSYESALGIGNDTFACSWLSELFCISAECEARNFFLLCQWVARVLMFTEFTVDRVRTVAKNLVSNCAEIKRSGSDCINAIATRVTTDLRGFETNTTYKAEDSADMRNKVRSDAPSSLRSDKVVLGNDVAISIFRQEPFLRRVVAEIKADRADAIVANLDKVRRHFLASLADIAAQIEGDTALVPGFAQLAVPTGFTAPGKLLDPVDAFVDTWNEVYSLYTDYTTYKECRVEANSRKRKTSTGDTITTIATKSFSSSFHRLAAPFPFPRTPYSPLTSRPQNLHVSLPSITTSYLLSIAPCDIIFDPNLLDPAPHLDHYATLLMCEILSRSEGPLFSAIRGNGYAYTASVSVYLWTGQIAFECREAADPAKAMRAFVEVLKKTEAEWETVCNAYEVETAKAGLVYWNCAERGTAGGVIGGALRSSLKVSLSLSCFFLFFFPVLSLSS